MLGFGAAKVVGAINAARVAKLKQVVKNEVSCFIVLLVCLGGVFELQLNPIDEMMSR